MGSPKSQSLETRIWVQIVYLGGNCRKLWERETNLERVCSSAFTVVGHRAHSCWGPTEHLQRTQLRIVPSPKGMRKCGYLPFNCPYRVEGSYWGIKSQALWAFSSHRPSTIPLTERSWRKLLVSIGILHWSGQVTSVGAKGRWLGYL